MNTAIITNSTATPSNRNKYAWMESQLQNEVIEYDSIKDLKSKLEELIKETDYALNKKLKLEPMYYDNEIGTAVQCGYTCNIMIDIDNKNVYFTLWITLKNISNINFTEEYYGMCTSCLEMDTDLIAIDGDYGTCTHCSHDE